MANEEKKTLGGVFLNGLIHENPTFTLMLGMCPTLAITTIMSYTAMSGAVGGGGLGMIAITYGYQRYRYAILYAAVVVLVVVVQVIQSFGTWLATKCDKRLKK